MSFYPRKGQFTSKRQGMDMAKRSHMCTACLHYQPDSFDACPKCGVDGMRVYFRSHIELARASELIHMQLRKEISQLKFLPQYDLIVDGVIVCKYEADSSYIEDGKQIVEDVKPNSGFMDKGAVLKIKLFNALHKKHGISVRLHRRK